MANEETIGRAKTYDLELIPQGKEAGKKIFNLLDSILLDKDSLSLPQKWISNYKFGKNQHWKEKSKKASLVSANLLYIHRQRTCNMLTDNNPTFNVAQIGEVDNEESIQTFLHTGQHWWLDQEQQHILEGSVNNGETYGCAIEHVRFNPDLEFGMGEVETLIIDPFHFGFWPVKCMDLQKCDAVFYYPTMSLREARRKWPKFADKIQADSEYLKSLGDERRTMHSESQGGGRSWDAVISNIVTKMMGNTDGERTASDEDEVLIVYCYVKDRTKIESSKKPGFMEPKYPGEIRFIATCNGGNIILEDRGNPSINPNLIEKDEAAASRTYLYDKFPFSKNLSIQDTSNPWGMTDFEQLKQLNIEMNKTLTQINLFKDKASRLILMNPQDTGVPSEKLTNYPVTVRPFNRMVSEGIKYVDPPQPPGDLAAALSMYKELFFVVAGTFELELAQTPGREVVAYKAIAALLERATTMMRGKVRNYSKMISERGRMFYSCAQNWYGDDRWITYEHEGQRLTKQISGESLRIPAKLLVVPGSTMPIARTQKREEAITLFKQGAIDNEELLKRMDWNNYKEIVNRMKQGPLGQLIQQFGAMGAPEPFLNIVQELIQMDMRDFEKAQKNGEIPPFNLIMEELMSGQPAQDPEKEAEIESKWADVEKTRIEIRKIDAEVELIDEKIVTERVNQVVKTTGIEFDEEKLKTERAKVVADIKAARMQQTEKGSESQRKKRTQGPFRERGLKSNNK